MNSYEIEQKLGRKADTWQIQNLEGEINRLQSANRELERTVGNLSSEINTTKEGFRRLLDYLSENSTSYDFNEIQNIKQYL